MGPGKWIAAIAALMRLHRLPLANPSLYNPASLVREVRRCATSGAPQSVKTIAECLA